MLIAPDSLAKERNKAQITSEDANHAVSLLLDIIIQSQDVATRVISYACIHEMPVCLQGLRQQIWQATSDVNSKSI